MAKKIVCYTLDVRLEKMLAEQAKRLSTTKTALVEQGLKMLFATEEGNAWLDKQADLNDILNN